MNTHEAHRKTAGTLKSKSAKSHIAILGAGPIGLEAALYARALGYTVTLYDKGAVAANIRTWGHIQLFSPWSYNRSALGLRRLREEGLGAPDLSGDDCPTGAELVRDYLAPLATLPELRGSVQENCEILACSRGNLLKKDIGGAVDRASQPFRLLVRKSGGRERFDMAEIVIDATGVFGEHNRLGEGGIPALGEMGVDSDIEYNPPDIPGQARGDYVGLHTVVAGAGFSGATSAVALAELTKAAPGTRVTWICRTENPQPMKAIPNDPLPNRRDLTAAGNWLAVEPPENFAYFGGYAVTGIEKNGDKFALTIENRSGETHLIECDRIIANVGYHPNERIYRQLHVHECYATLGPIDLAASLMGQDIVDCFAVQAGAADLLRTPEPNFYILGAKSFGTTPNFLIYLGHEHIAQLFTLITSDERLNLYSD